MLRSALTHVLTLGVGLCLLVGLCADGPPSALARLPDGRHIRFICKGQGAPVVLLESGFGAGAEAWPRVQAGLAPDHMACSYDRAGYGLSDPGPLPRDGAAIARDLDQALRAQGIRGPFIAVGHSAGGLYVRLFANLHPRDVIGMVLVDPSVEHQDRQFAMFGPNAGSVAPIVSATQLCLDLSEGRMPSKPDRRAVRCFFPPGSTTLLPASLWRAQLSEITTLFNQTSDQVAAGRASYGDLPLIVLTAGGTAKDTASPGQGQVLARWRELHQDVAARSTRGEERLVDNSSHLIMKDRPDAVIAAVNQVIAEAAVKPAKH